MQKACEHLVFSVCKGYDECGNCKSSRIASCLEGIVLRSLARRRVGCLVRVVCVVSRFYNTKGPGPKQKGFRAPHH